MKLATGRHRRRLAGVLSLAALLGGCITLAEPTVTDGKPIAAPVETVSATPREFSNPGNLALSTPQNAQPLPPLETLTGLDSVGLQELLGAPAFTRRDDPAQLWQYRGDRCTLDIFLYRPAGGGDFQVDYFATRAFGSAEISTEACFHSVINGGGKTG